MIEGCLRLRLNLRPLGPRVGEPSLESKCLLISESAVPDLRAQLTLVLEEEGTLGAVVLARQNSDLDTVRAGHVNRLDARLPATHRHTARHAV